MQAQKANLPGKKRVLSRLLENTHASLPLNRLAKRTASTPALVDFSRASHLDLFEQPARAFFNTLLGIAQDQVLVRLVVIIARSVILVTDLSLQGFTRDQRQQHSRQDDQRSIDEKRHSRIETVCENTSCQRRAGAADFGDGSTQCL
jgi:hypothetical protein